MSDADRSFINRLFAVVVAFLAIFLFVAVVGGFVAARLLGLPVNIDKFYSLIQPAAYAILGVVVTVLVGNKGNADTPRTDKEPPA